MAAYDPAPWQNFAVAEVGAAAALAGLLVVAASINIERVMTLPHLVSRLSRTLSLFGMVLVAATLLLVPADVRTLGIAISVVSGLAVIVSLRIRGLRGVQRNYRNLAIFASGLGALAGVLVCVSGIGLATHSVGGLYWMAPGVLLAFLVGLLNAWVALVEIRR